MPFPRRPLPQRLRYICGEGREIGQLVIGAAIVGAQRSGTTWLSRSLEAHPVIRLATGKEAHLFDRSDVQLAGPTTRDLVQYFPDVHGNEILLDATPSYLYLPGCLEALKLHNPDAKVIALIRDPGQRAISHYYHSRRRGVERENLISALWSEKRRLARGREAPIASQSPLRDFSYRDRGRYGWQLRRLLGLFPDALIIPFPRIVTSPRAVLAEVQQFLGIDFFLLPELPIQNSMARPSHVMMGKLISMTLLWETRQALRVLGWEQNTLVEVKS